MEFLIPQVPSAGRQGQATGNSAGALLLTGINNHTNENYHLLRQAQQKMTKKQLKLAQAQLDKLTQINIHLHGMLLLFRFFISIIFI